MTNTWKMPEYWCQEWVAAFGYNLAGFEKGVNYGGPLFVETKNTIEKLRTAKLLLTPTERDQWKMPKDSGAFSSIVHRGYHNEVVKQMQARIEELEQNNYRLRTERNSLSNGLKTRTKMFVQLQQENEWLKKEMVMLVSTARVSVLESKKLEEREAAVHNKSLKDEGDDLYEKIGQLEQENERLSKMVWMSVAELCSKYNIQNCSYCENLTCGDNTSEIKKKIEHLARGYEQLLQKLRDYRKHL